MLSVTSIKNTVGASTVPLGTPDVTAVFLRRRSLLNNYSLVTIS